MIKKISITGGIGSGKSTVLDILKSFGYCVWDADDFVSHAFKQKHIEERIKELLGKESYLEPGKLDRAFVRQKVFFNLALKNVLEDILHPEVQKSLQDRLHLLEAQGVSCWIFYEASLIFETKRHHFFDANILVTADIRKRLQRLRKSKNLSEEFIQQIMSTQMSDKEKKRQADFSLENSSTYDELERKVLKLIQFLKKKF